MYDTNGYGFPVEGRTVARVIEMTDRGFGFAVPEGGRAKLYFHVSGQRQIQIIDGVCEWRHFSSVSKIVLPVIGQEIVFDKFKGANQIEYWWFREDFDEIYYSWCRQRRTARQLAFAGC